MIVGVVVAFVVAFAVAVVVEVVLAVVKVVAVGCRWKYFLTVSALVFVVVVDGSVVVDVVVEVVIAVVVVATSSEQWEFRSAFHLHALSSNHVKKSLNQFLKDLGIYSYIMYMINSISHMIYDI